ncbi:hypothetical protein RchiOBHm_Chr5g0019741 [Rosa chinensis]|uniref:Uncharacterized protein n=1 Tax=Rosa chinensis TaxID=74649 RepID=A0A2P6Q743_ROSCH|nr:hypothetical protein RchiOBHm_Chr5g0019741 [Rosa chinensis]
MSRWSICLRAIVTSGGAIGMRGCRFRLCRNWARPCLVALIPYYLGWWLGLGSCLWP